MARGGLPAKYNDMLQSALAELHRGRYGYENMPWDFIDMLLIAGSDGIEIANTLSIHKTALYAACERDKNRPWRLYKAQRRSAGNAMIRLAKFQKALEGDSRLLDRESKQRLGEVDNPNEIKEGKDGGGGFAIFELADNGRSVKDQNPLNHSEKEHDEEETGDLSGD